MIAVIKVKLLNKNYLLHKNIIIFKILLFVNQFVSL